MQKLILLIGGLLFLPPRPSLPQAEKPPVRFAIVGLTHDHAGGFIPRTRNRTDVQLVGIVESKPDLVARYASRFQLNTNLFCASLDELLARTNVQAVATF